MLVKVIINFFLGKSLGEKMSTFPISEDEYSVEEISYEDMVSILSVQQRDKPESILEINEEPLQLAKNESDSDIRLSSHVNQPNQDELSLRLSENANKTLPAWLLNH